MTNYPITKLRTTQDGSHTLYVPELDEYYHSMYGAIQESVHVFLKQGFLSMEGGNIIIFEIGFGTGLNAFLTYIEAEKINREVVYHSIELYPVKTELINNLNYPEYINPGKREDFYYMHGSPWNEEVRIAPFFLLKKINEDLRSYKFDNNYNIVYFDAFAPDKQPELWQPDIFRDIYDNLSDNGILVTYCSKVQVRKILESVGFIVEKVPGPPGKREVVRAVKR